MTTDNQSPRGGLRQCQRRAQVFEDVRPYPVSTDYAAADLVTTRAGSTWGNPVEVRGRDEVGLLVTFTKVAGQTGLVIAFQDGCSDGKDDEVWYDRYATENAIGGDNPAIPTTPRDLTLDVSGFADGEHRILVAVRVRALYMRFKPYGAGTVTASRCTISVVRLLQQS